MTQPRPKRVVIIGGGIAGLATAETLCRTQADRFHVTLLEAKRLPGGRAGSFLDVRSGESIDYCQHVTMGCCTNLLDLTARCELDHAFRPIQTLTFLHPDYPPSQFAPSSWLPPPLHLLPALQGLRFLSRSQRREILRCMWQLMRTDPASLANEPAASWLRRRGQRDQTIRQFWEVILVSALGERIEAVSMAAARKVLIDGFASARGASDVLLPTVPLAELFGVQLPQAISNLGADIRASTPVRRIVKLPQNRIAVETSDGEMIPADHVVSAVPWHAVGRLFQNDDIIRQLPSLSAWEAFPASPITGIHLWFDREITRRTHAALVGTAAQWLFRRDPLDYSSSPSTVNSSEHYYQVVISASHDTTNGRRRALIDQVVSELQQLFPQARQARLLRSRMVRDPQAVFSAQPAVESQRPPSRTPVPWLHLAGDWTATGWPATMEGAVISGRHAAASLLEQEGLPSPKIAPGLRYQWLAKRLIRMHTKDPAADSPPSPSRLA